MRYITFLEELRKTHDTEADRSDAPGVVGESSLPGVVVGEGHPLTVEIQ